MNLFTVPNSLTELSSSSLIGRFVRSSLFVHDKVLHSPQSSSSSLSTRAASLFTFVIFCYLFSRQNAWNAYGRAHNRWWASSK